MVQGYLNVKYDRMKQHGYHRKKPGPTRNDGGNLASDVPLHANLPYESERR